MGLFTTTDEQRRQVFIARRFSESRDFGRRDIVSWLSAEREADAPDRRDYDSKGWRYLAERHFLSTLRSVEVNVLRSYATAYSVEGLRQEKGVLVPDDFHRKSLDFLQQILHEDMLSEIYFGHSLVVVAGGSDRPAVALAWGSGLRPLRPDHVVDVLHDEWRRGDAKSAEARAWLCDALTPAVEKVRAEAERDYERAVAVDESGEMISCADYVIVLVKRKWMQYPAEAFSERKILRVDPRRRKFSKTEATRIQEVLPKHLLFQKLPDWTRFWITEPDTNRESRSWCTQAIVELEADGSKYFLAGSWHAPDPLPSGGVMIGTAKEWRS